LLDNLSTRILENLISFQTRCRRLRIIEPANQPRFPINLAIIDLDNKFIETPVGDFAISKITLATIWFSRPSSESPNEGSIDRGLLIRSGHFAFSFTLKRERRSAIPITCARAFTANTVRLSSSAMSKSEALEMTSSRSRSSSSEVQALQLFIFLVAISSGHVRFRETRREVNFPANLRLQWRP
jgi:hypothetical protein